MKGGNGMENKDELLELINHEEDQQFNKKIESKMEKKLTKKIIRKMVVWVLSALFVIEIVNIGLNVGNYNPEKEDIDFNTIINSFIQTYYPDATVGVIDIQSLGFGAYDISMDVVDNMGYRRFGSNKKVLEIRQSKIKDLVGLNSIVNEFDRESLSEYAYEKNPQEVDELISELEKLPESSIILASVVLKMNWNLEKMVNLIKKYPHSEFTWLAMEQPQHLQGAITGMSLESIFGYSDLEQYPDLNDQWKRNDEEFTAENIKKYYLENLELLADHQKAYTMLTQNYVNRSYDKFLEQVEYSKEHQECIGFRIHANANDLIDMLKSGMVSYVWINDVRLSIYSR